MNDGQARGAGQGDHSEQTRQFYDTEGWRRGHDGELGDQARFYGRNIGPLRDEMHRLRMDRIRAAIGRPGKLIECGCGANPERELFDVCGFFTAADFSRVGLAEAAARLEARGVPHETVVADLRQLPFPDQSFDAAYSAHALYHIDSLDGQAAAFDSILRIVKSGGVAVFVLANPFPLLFPIRMLRRLSATIPGISWLLNRLRRRPPLPYLPARLGWMRRRLEPWGHVDISCYAMASTWSAQHVGEQGIGRRYWGVLAWLERRHPRASTWLGNYVTIVVRKR